MDWLEATKRLSQGEIGVLPTDTLYGIVGLALRPAVVEKIYELRQRELGKPMIVLISSLDDLSRFQIEISDRTQYLLNKVWPGPVSVVLAAKGSGLVHLHRGTGGIAFRMPSKPDLRKLLQAAGPVVAPSANLAGEPPAVNVAEAKAYFGEAAFYLDEGELHNPPSALVDGRTDEFKILRPAPNFKIQ